MIIGDRPVERGDDPEWTLKLTKARLDSLSDYHPDGVFALDLQGNFTALNSEALIQSGGYSPESLLGHNFATLLFDDDVPTVLGYFASLLERQENHHMIRWDPAGEHIIVERPEQLALHVLPSIYRQSRFASFSRQLNVSFPASIPPARCSSPHSSRSTASCARSISATSTPPSTTPTRPHGVRSLPSLSFHPCHSLTHLSPPLPPQPIPP